MIASTLPWMEGKKSRDGREEETEGWDIVHMDGWPSHKYKKNHHENKTPLPPPEANVQCENTHTHRG